MLFWWKITTFLLLTYPARPLLSLDTINVQLVYSHRALELNTLMQFKETSMKILLVSFTAWARMSLSLSSLVAPLAAILIITPQHRLTTQIHNNHEGRNIIKIFPKVWFYFAQFPNRKNLLKQCRCIFVYRLRNECGFVHTLPVNWF